MGGAFGFGLKRNILDAYKFVCRNYDHQNHSKIYLFGFSRGAFTVRVLAALILQQGLIVADTEGELHDGAVKAYRAYRAKGYHSIWGIEKLFRAIRDYMVVPALDLLKGNKSYSQISRKEVPAIEFIDVWDTVAAYGLPMDEMTRGISNWVWPLELPNRILSPRVKCARRALALDDERTTFHPVLWTEEGESGGLLPSTIDNERLVQVWFVGMHANVGGGYPDDAVSFVPLSWLVEESIKHGLVFKAAPFADPDSVKWITSSQDKDGRLYDSRSGLGAYYRYGPARYPIFVTTRMWASAFHCRRFMKACSTVSTAVATLMRQSDCLPSTSLSSGAGSSLRLGRRLLRHLLERLHDSSRRKGCGTSYGCDGLPISPHWELLCILPHSGSSMIASKNMSSSHRSEWSPSWFDSWSRFCQGLFTGGLTGTRRTQNGLLAGSSPWHF